MLKDGELAIEAQETRVWAARDPANPDRIKGVPVPTEVVEKLSAG
jgi:4-hydroxybenzoyl-CoA thioesterase